jgi:hypothetical protein
MSDHREPEPVPPARDPYLRTTIYTYDPNGALTNVKQTRPGEGPAADAPLATPAPEEPRWSVAYEPARHVIRLTDPEGKAAEFDDRPVRFLVMTRNRRTKALEPLIVRGEPQYYYLSRERER